MIDFYISLELFSQGIVPRTPSRFSSGFLSRFLQGSAWEFALFSSENSSEILLWIASGLFLAIPKRISPQIYPAVSLGILPTFFSEIAHIFLLFSFYLQISSHSLEILSMIPARVLSEGKIHKSFHFLMIRMSQ